MNREQLLKLGESFSGFEMEEVKAEEVKIDHKNEVMEEVAPVLKSNSKIKEVKYGMSILKNIGNFENIRTNIEVVAEVSENDSLDDCLDDLSVQIKAWAKKSYQEIRRNNR